jgi:mono/diheme cytochrome c family protein
MLPPSFRTGVPLRNNREAILELAFLATAAFILSACTGQGAATTTTAATPGSPGASPAVATAGGSTPAGVVPAASSVSFSKDVLPILQGRCVSCHAGPGAPRGLDMTSYSSLMAGAANGPVVVPGNPDGSPFIQMILQGTMPKSGPKLLPKQIQTLSDWVKAGAPNN